ncbi:HPF/RaiA family ribosome-associated protein [Chitinophaga cymbidii]|uniref:Ribosomal subunit interface protein n=1 Tax=Chitinophaga cymbidii TaxID=1096750 RepID=A0A512RTA2_9BACT|nr:HPF/RaiA family ribosome-associated protein [Chitinophaga cymbidii]GEP98928.1 hypothetical protein CCY01nite_51880 [Chitinophaga cymbidii]
MDIIIQSLGFKAGEALESFIREKLDTIKSDRIIRANVGLYMGAESDPDKNFCEILLEIPGNDLFVKKNNAFFETAVSECVEVLKQQINREKDKNIDARQANGEKIQDALIEGTARDEDTDLEDVVK